MRRSGRKSSGKYFSGMPDRSHQDSPPARKVSRKLSAEETERIARETSEIDDPDLREAIASLLSKHLSNTTEK